MNHRLEEALADEASLIRLQTHSTLTEKRRKYLSQRDLPKFLDLPIQHPFEDNFLTEKRSRGKMLTQ